MCVAAILNDGGTAGADLFETKANDNSSCYSHKCRHFGHEPLYPTFATAQRQMILRCPPSRLSSPIKSCANIAAICHSMQMVQI